MTKNFEEEYKKYAANSVPDLWSRIEAAIDEAESIKDTNDNNVTAEVLHDNKTVDFNRNKVFRLKPYITAIAAAACLFLAIGVIRFIGGANKNAETASAPAAMESAAEAMSDTAAVESEAAEEYYDEAANDMTYEAEAETEEAEEAAPMGETFDEAIAEEAPEAKHTYNAVQNDNYTPEETPGAEGAAYAAEAGQAYSNDESLSLAKQNENSERKAVRADDIPVELICEIEDLSGLEKNREFTAIVTDPLDSELKKDNVITVKVKDDAEESLFDVLIDSRTYEYKLTLQPEKDGSYTLVSAEIKK